MTDAKREQLQSRLAEIDEALAALRRGYSRHGAKPPAVCELMLRERRDIQRMLALDAAVARSGKSIDWNSSKPTDFSDPTPPFDTEPISRRQSWWQRLQASLRAMLGGRRVKS